jgi:hypothetical protein
MILVSLLNPKFAKVSAEQSCEFRVRDTRPRLTIARGLVDWAIYWRRTGAQSPMDTTLNYAIGAIVLAGVLVVVVAAMVI